MRWQDGRFSSIERRHSILMGHSRNMSQPRIAGGSFHRPLKAVANAKKVTPLVEVRSGVASLLLRCQVYQ